MLEEKVKEERSETEGRPAVGRRNSSALRNYLAAAAVAIVGYTGCDSDTCETNADCDEGARCLRRCERCIQESFSSDIDDHHIRCVQEEVTYRSPGEERRSGWQCGANHCYRPHETTTYTRED